MVIQKLLRVMYSCFFSSVEKQINEVINIDNDWECSYCLSSKNNKLIKIKPCGHIFHDQCQIKWFLYRMDNSCSVCRTPINSIIVSNHDKPISIDDYCFVYHSNIKEGSRLYIHIHNKHNYKIKYRRLPKLYKDLRQVLPNSVVQNIFLTSKMDSIIHIQGGFFIFSEQKLKNSFISSLCRLDRNL